MDKIGLIFVEFINENEIKYLINDWEMIFKISENSKAEQHTINTSFSNMFSKIEEFIQNEDYDDIFNYSSCLNTNDYIDFISGVLYGIKKEKVKIMFLNESIEWTSNNYDIVMKTFKYVKDNKIISNPSKLFVQMIKTCMFDVETGEYFHQRIDEFIDLLISEKYTIDFDLVGFDEVGCCVVAEITNKLLKRLYTLTNQQ